MVRHDPGRIDDCLSTPIIDLHKSDCSHLPSLDYLDQMIAPSRPF